AARCPACPRWLLNAGSSRVPGRRCSERPPLAGRLPPGWLPWLGRTARLGTTPEVDPHPGEDRRPLADRQPDRVWLCHRTVDLSVPRPPHRAGVGHRPLSTIPEPLAAGPGLYPTATPPG